MGRVNQPEDWGSILRALRAEIKAVRDRVGNISAYIGQGGLTIGEDGSLKMIDDSGTQILFFGPDNSGRQIIRIRREGGSDVLWTGFTGNGNQFWRLTDRFGNRELFSDDTENGGIARPWFAIPMTARFSMAAGSVFSYRTVAASALAAETNLWVGRIPLVSQPFLALHGVWGEASGVNSSTYRVRLNGTQVGTWSMASPGFELSTKGPFNITSFLDQTAVQVTVTASATGTGAVACDVEGLWTRQT